MSNSSLATYTKISPNRTSPRNHKIDTITIHCFVGQVTAQSGCNCSGFRIFDERKGASCNYVVGYDGSIGLCVEEKDRSWCSSNRQNDHRSVTIETASDTKAPYAVTQEAYNALLDLVTDICQRNGIRRLIWFANMERTLGYQRQEGEACLTVHRWFANKSCPGDYLYNLHGQIADEVTRRLNRGEVKTEITTSMFIEYIVKKNDTLTKIEQKYGVSKDAILALNPSIKDPNKIYVGQVIKVPTATEAVARPAFMSYYGRVSVKSSLNVRAMPGTSKECKIIRALANGTRVKIVDEKFVLPAMWGQLSNGGWVCLNYIRKV